VKRGKPHLMQDQIGFTRTDPVQVFLTEDREVGRSLEVVSNDDPREMTISCMKMQKTESGLQIGFYRFLE